MKQLDEAIDVGPRPGDRKPLGQLDHLGPHFTVCRRARPAGAIDPLER
jgi:hypothetical protein